MDACGGRSSKGMQDTCFASCEGKNNLCSESVYGKRPFNGAPSTVRRRRPGQGCMAKKEKTQEKIQDAPREQAADDLSRKRPEVAPSSACRKALSFIQTA